MQVMQPRISKIIEEIKHAIPDANVTIDESPSGGSHFLVTVKSTSFLNLPEIEQHQIVRDALRLVCNSECGIAIRTFSA